MFGVIGWINHSYVSIGVTAEVVLAGGDNLACAPLNATLYGPYVGKFVLVDRGGCFFKQKDDMVTAAGAIGWILSMYRRDGWFHNCLVTLPL